MTESTNETPAPVVEQQPDSPEALDQTNKLAAAILSFLEKASGPQKLGLKIGLFSDPITQAALDRCTFNGWLRLVDISPVEGQEGMFRVFILTASGQQQKERIIEYFKAGDAAPADQPKH